MSEGGSDSRAAARSGTEGTLRLSLDVSAVPEEPVGAGRYTLDLVAALSRRSDVELTLWTRRKDASRWHELTSESAASQVRPTAPGPRPARLVWEQTGLPLAMRRRALDVHHGPHYTMPEHTSVARVVTIHDMTFYDHPEWHERKKVPVFRRAISVAARKATALICVSESARRRLEERCGPTGQVFVVPHGVDHRRFHPAVPGDGSDERSRSALGVCSAYVLFLGTLEPRKAVPELVFAFAQVSRSYPELQLVLAGRDGWGVTAVDRAVSTSGVRNRIVRTGYVPDEAVPALLRGAAAVAYPAYEEGFGLPALEALACAAPLVTTAGSAMAEMAGEAATSVEAGSVDGLAAALGEVLSRDRAEVSRRRVLGLEIARSHTWEASADAHLEVYRWAVSARRRQSG